MSAVVKRGVSSRRTCTGSWERRAESQSGGGRTEASHLERFPSMQHDIMNQSPDELKKHISSRVLACEVAGEQSTWTSELSSQNWTLDFFFFISSATINSQDVKTNWGIFLEVHLVSSLFSRAKQ